MKRDYSFGKYEDAIARWEKATHVTAPAPTEPGSKGQPVLSPRFVEWMMGLPQGHVTDVGLSRTQQLRALGNGVVPLQALKALEDLWAIATVNNEQVAACT